MATQPRQWKAPLTNLCGILNHHVGQPRSIVWLGVPQPRQERRLQVPPSQAQLAVVDWEERLGNSMIGCHKKKETILATVELEELKL